MAFESKQTGESPPSGLELKKLTAGQIRQIDEILASLDGSGEVQLIVQRGELRFIKKIEFHSAGGAVSRKIEI